MERQIRQNSPRKNDVEKNENTEYKIERKIEIEIE
jgi:hypothetical protein